jgi:hypothetical protein
MRLRVVALFAGIATMFAVLPLAAFALFMDGSSSGAPTTGDRTVEVTSHEPAGDNLAMGVSTLPCLEELPAAQG